MADDQIANLTLEVNPEALRSVIASGRLLEFADTVAAQASSQISAQLVQRVAEGALDPERLSSGVAAEVSYRLVIGDGEPGYGTVPRPPRWVVSAVSHHPGSLSQPVDADAES